MPTVELTDRFCRAAKSENAPQTDYFDTAVTGLALRASKGGTRAFYLHYTRPADGKRARVRLGAFPDMSLAKAREAARSTRGDVGDGKDPASEKQAYAASQTVRDLVDNYVSRHASTKRTADAIARRLRKNVSDVIGAVKLADLHRRDITKCIDAVVDRGAAVEANRVFEDLRAMLRWAKGRGDLDENLADGMRRPTETVPRDRVLGDTEIAAFWKGLTDADMRESTRRVLRLCLVTAQRVGEVSGMALAELDLEGRKWTIPPARAKNGREHVVPLSDMAVSIIREQLAENEALAKRKGRDAPQWVFPGPGARAAVTGHAIAKAVKREEKDDEQGRAKIFGIEPFTPHDLRRTAATQMERLGVSPFIVGHVLNHASVTRATVTTQVYARYDYAAEKRGALDAWCRSLLDCISSGAEA